MASPNPVVLEALRIYLEDPCGTGGTNKPCGLVPKPCRCEGCQAGKTCCGFPSYEDCAHIAALRESGHGADCPIPAEQAGIMLEDRNGEYAPDEIPWCPGDYREPPLAPLPVDEDGNPVLDENGNRVPECRMPRAKEWKVFNERADIHRADDLPRYSLRRPDDVLPGHLDKVAEQGELGKRRSGLTTRAVMARRILAERAELEYRGSIELLAEKAAADTRRRSRQLHRGLDRMIDRYRIFCEARSHDRYVKPTGWYAVRLLAEHQDSYRTSLLDARKAA